MINPILSSGRSWNQEKTQIEADTKVIDSRLVAEGVLAANDDGVRITDGFRRVADEVILRLWEETERLRQGAASH